MRVKLSAFDYIVFFSLFFGFPSVLFVLWQSESLPTWIFWAFLFLGVLAFMGGYSHAFDSYYSQTIKIKLPRNCTFIFDTTYKTEEDFEKHLEKVRNKFLPTDSLDQSSQTKIAIILPTLYHPGLYKKAPVSDHKSIRVDSEVEHLLLDFADGVKYAYRNGVRVVKLSEQEIMADEIHRIWKRKKGKIS